MSNKSDAQKKIRKLSVILDNYNIPYDEDIEWRLCHLLCKADEACRQVVIDVHDNKHEDIQKYVNDFDKYLHAEEETEKEY